jgi:hypothetical protein
MRWPGRQHEHEPVRGESPAAPGAMAAETVRDATRAEPACGRVCLQVFEGARFTDGLQPGRLQERDEILRGAQCLTQPFE